MTTKKEQKIIDKAISDYDKRYNELYEILYQDTQRGVEYIMQLEDDLKLQKTLVKELRKLKNK